MKIVTVDISKYNMTEKELDNLVEAFKTEQLENKSLSTAIWSKPDIETLNLTIKMLYEEIKNGDVAKIQALATAIKELAIAKTALSDSKTELFKFYIE